MYLDTSEDYLYGEKNAFQPVPISSLKKKKKEVKGDFVLPPMGATNAIARKQQKQLAIAAFYREENARLRKPCPKCGTLVQPRLLGQHYEAYHPDVEITTAE